MIEKTIQARWQALQLPLYAAIVGCIIFTLVAICGAGTSVFLYIFVIAPTLVVISVGSIVWLIHEVIGNRYGQFLPTLGMLAVLWAISMSLCFTPMNIGVRAIANDPME